MRRYRRKFKKAVKKYYKRKYGRGRKYSKHGRIRSRYQGLLLPDRLKVKLRYTIDFTLTLDGNGLVAEDLAGNDPFDPDNSGTPNGQPTGWDQYTAYYRFWYCPGSKIKCRMINVNNDIAAANNPILGNATFGIVPGTNILSTADLVTMQPRGWPYSKEAYVSSFPASNVKTLTNYMATKKMYGYKTSTNSNFIAQVTTSPTNKWYWNFYVKNQSALAASGQKYDFHVELTYYVHFFGRQEIALS